MSSCVCRRWRREETAWDREQGIFFALEFGRRRSDWVCVQYRRYCVLRESVSGWVLLFLSTLIRSTDSRNTTDWLVVLSNLSATLQLTHTPHRFFPPPANCKNYYYSIKLYGKHWSLVQEWREEGEKRRREKRGEKRRVRDTQSETGWWWLFSIQ